MQTLTQIRNVSPVVAPAARPRPAARLCVRYVVTFEYEREPPQTLRGEISAPSVDQCYRWAVKTAAATLRPSRWTSVVCVLDRTTVGRLGSAHPEETAS